ncbi:dual specificity protein phosphatase MPK-4-like [Homalodisca vitripennis]|uniref:dual specificity protein phosphatase MPK-4-like n=1 Tax=Homalodisca vitripennis TaxID=197043 RepID=UPI001EEAF138|nr:dual specificity protein phosphatase MPK-4-like [Homalodisca vitripennis]
MLKREDFDAGPSSIDLIETGLFLGNVTAATDKNVLESNKINRIITVDSCPLPLKITDLPGIKTLFIQVTDLPQEDLLAHFEETYNFIKNSQDQKNVLLVHCYFGVSRSATVVIAFIMKKYGISYQDAFERVKSLRRFVGPNAGFEAQLQLFERMNYTIDRNNLQYKMYRLKLAAEKVKKVKILPLDCLDVVQPDPSLIRVSPDPLVYRCCKCRRIIASAANLMPHIPREKPSWKDAAWPAKVKEQPACMATYFVEPMIWMKPALQSEQGKLHCPKCNSKLGSFSWIMGCQCPCGSKISPAFYLVPSKVEWSNIVQNVQVTV